MNICIWVHIWHRSFKHVTQLTHVPDLTFPFQVTAMVARAATSRAPVSARTNYCAISHTCE